LSRVFGRHVAVEPSAEYWRQVLKTVGFTHGFAPLSASPGFWSQVQQGYCEPDLHVFAKLFEDRLERGLEAQALSRRGIGGDDDVLNFFVGHLVDVDLTIQLRGVGPASAAILTREIFGRRFPTDGNWAPTSGETDAHTLAALAAGGWAGKFDLNFGTDQDEACRVWSVRAATRGQARQETPGDNLFSELHTVLHAQPERKL
jgi:hypothetical protein